MAREQGQLGTDWVVDPSTPEAAVPQASREPFAEPRSGAAFEHAACGIAVLSSDGSVLAANAALAEMLGVARGGLIERDLGEVLASDHPALFEEILARTVRAGRQACVIDVGRVRASAAPPFSGRMRIEAALAPSADNGDGPYCIVLVHEVLQPAPCDRNEAALASRVFRNAFEATPVSTAIRDVESGEEWVNPAMLDLLGYSADEYRAAPFEQLVHKDDLLKLRAEISSVLAGGNALPLREVRIIHREGRILHGQVYFSVVAGVDGQPRYVVSQIVDISETKHTERRLRQRSEFDRVVTALATNFINLAVDKIDLHIERALQQVARFVGADRAAVVLFGDAFGERAELRKAWTADGRVLSRELFDVGVWDFAAHSLIHGDTVYEDDLIEDPPVRDATRDTLLAHGIRSFVAVPFRAERRSGFVGFASSEAQAWDVERLALLRIGAEMIANVLERASIEHALRESEERLRQMADNVQTLFWVADLEPLRLGYASRALADLFGVALDTDGEPDLAALDRILVPEDWPVVLDALARSRSSRTSFECRIRRGDGIRWLKTRIFPVCDSEGVAKRIAGVTDDITADKVAQAEREENSRFERLISRLAAGFINLPADRIDAAIEDALRAVGEFSQVDIAYFLRPRSDPRSVDEIYAWTSATGQPYRNRLSDVTLSDYPWTLDRLLTGELLHVPDMRQLPEEARAERAAAKAIGLCSAVTCPLVLAGELIGVLGFSSLATPRQWSPNALALVELVAAMFSSAVDRRHAQAEIARRSSFETLIRHLAMDLVNLPDADLDAGIEAALGDLAQFVGFDTAAIYEIDAGGTTASCSQHWPAAVARESLPTVSITDKSWMVGRLMDRSAVQVVHTSELPPAAKAERALLESRGVTSMVQVPMFDSKGPRAALCLESLSERREVDPEMQSMLQIAAQLFVNTTERRRAERSVLTHQADLAHALRLGTMGELAPWLAHELNQPLAAIMSFARGCQLRLEAGNVDSEELLHAAEEVSRQALRAAEVVQSLRRHVRQHEPRRVWQTVNEIVTLVLGMLGQEAKQRGVEMRCRLEAESVWIQVDPIQIEQVLLNLLRNGFDAIEARPGGSREIEVLTLDAGSFVEVVVQDSGIGLQDVDHTGLFDAFRSTKPGGLGLGLGLCRSIVESHGGRIRAESVGGGGAAFRFTIPCRSQAPAEPK